ncbi:hypothetical protein K456DRAFT_1825446 [Colletotrichum gloeosporioides 23]|nr:hypothetical protein K456DRAFT_1825446 [Colletotrichum gloeosporioides 23]
MNKDVEPGAKHVLTPYLNTMIKGLANGGLTPTLQQWMRIHVTRSVTVDLFCWVTAIITCAKTLSS